MKASEGQERAEALEAARQIRRGATQAQVRYRRALRFLDEAGLAAENAEEKARSLQGLARALVRHEQLFAVEKGAHQGDFGTDLLKLLQNERDVTERERTPESSLAALTEAKTCAKDALALLPLSADALLTLAVCELALG